MFIHGIFPIVLDWWYSEHIEKAKERVDKINEGREKGCTSKKYREKI